VFSVFLFVSHLSRNFARARTARASTQSREENRKTTRKATGKRIYALRARHLQQEFKSLSMSDSDARDAGERQARKQDETA
jgi:hypothetical protein